MLLDTPRSQIDKRKLDDSDDEGNDDDSDSGLNSMKLGKKAKHSGPKCKGKGQTTKKLINCEETVENEDDKVDKNGVMPGGEE